MKVNGQLKNAQLEITDTTITDGTKAQVAYNTECNKVEVGNGTDTKRLMDDCDMPVGSIVVWPVPNAPNAQWEIVHGQALNTADYPELYSVLGGWYGEDTVAGTFNLPDYGGQFLRSVPGPNSDKPRYTDERTGAPGGGINQVGSTQGDAILDHVHQHSDAFYITDLNNSVVGNLPFGSNPGQDLDNQFNLATRNTRGVLWPTGAIQREDIALENRPCNISVYYIIKVK